MYAYVVNNTVNTTAGALPQTWRNADGSTVSNFHLLPDEQRRAAGWWPVTEVYADLSVNQHHGAPTYTVDAGARTVTATYPAVADAPEVVNDRTLRTKIQTAIGGNVTWTNAHATRQTAIDQLKADATAGKTVTVTTVGQAQTAIRNMADAVLRCANGLSDLEARLMAVTQQITAIERTIVGKLDSTDDT